MNNELKIISLFSVILFVLGIFQFEYNSAYGLGLEGGDNTPPIMGTNYWGSKYIEGGFTINGQSFDVEISNQEIPTQILRTNESNTVILKVYENSGPQYLRHVELHFGIFHERVSGILLENSKSSIIWNKKFDRTESVYTNDPSKILENVTVNATQHGNLMHVTINFEITKPMEKNTIMIHTWDEDRNGWKNYFLDAIQVIDSNQYQTKNYAKNSETDFTAGTFVSKYQNEFSKGKWVNVLVKVKGEPESDDPRVRAKEVRYIQASVLKFTHFAGAINVKSDTWKNEFTAFMTSSLAEALVQRSDVISITILDEDSKKSLKKICDIFRPGVDLGGCDLYGVNLSFKDLRGINFSGANLKGANLNFADLSGANLQKARLSYASLDFANLTNANLTSAWMIGTDIRNADLSGANLYRATMWRADFTSSNLSFADLRLSILTNAILSFVNLDGANLEGSGTWNTNLNHCYGHEICE